MNSSNKPVRVAQIIGKWVGGGVEAVVMNYYRNIDRNKIQFDFICDEDSTNIPYEEISKLGGRVILVPPYQKMIKYHKKLKNILKNGKYTIVHSHINTLSVFSLFAAKCAGVPVRIAHSHSTTDKKEWKKNLIKLILRPFSKRYATHYFCCSELAGRWLFGNSEYNNGNVFLLNNAIDLEKFKYNPKIRELKRKNMGINEDTLIVGHIGRFVEQKNHLYLIDIFYQVHKLIPNSILILAGQGPLERNVKEKVHILELDDCVRFLGQVTAPNELYQAMDVFVLPSLYEGLPVVGVEAQAAGLFCFFSDNMTKETKILPCTKFVSLSESALNWATIIVDSYNEQQRIDAEKYFSKKGYNIKKEAVKLEEFYMKWNKKYEEN